MLQVAYPSLTSWEWHRCTGVCLGKLLVIVYFPKIAHKNLLENSCLNDMQINQGQKHAEEKEMGGRAAREQLKYKLPEFSARTQNKKSPGKSHL